jgi:hypothetical protein
MPRVLIDVLPLWISSSVQLPQELKNKERGHWFQVTMQQRVVKIMSLIRRIKLKAQFSLLSDGF